MNNESSETFGNVPQRSEEFGKLPNLSERTKNHTLTVRAVVKMFEQAGVARTERSIVNWCSPNKQGMTRLHCYYDPNEHKYFITPESVGLAIKEEKSKLESKKVSADSEDVGNVPKASEQEPGSIELQDKDNRNEKNIEELKGVIVDLKITNRVKDAFIKGMTEEKNNMLTKLLVYSRKVGELETKLLQLEAPKEKQLNKDEAVEAEVEESAPE